MGEVTLKMKCDICSSSLSTQNIGYVKVLSKREKIFECRRCHSRKRAKMKKPTSLWVF